MKRAQLILASFLFSMAFSLTVIATPSTDFNRTVILINGIPILVDLDTNGDVIKNIAFVYDYFESSESHEALIKRTEDDYKSELANITSRLVIFDENQDLANSTIIDHVRDLARLYSKGYVKNIHIVASHSEDFQDEALAANRINNIYQLLKDFGVDDKSITANTKIYKSELPNVFVKLDIEK